VAKLFPDMGHSAVRNAFRFGPVIDLISRKRKCPARCLLHRGTLQTHGSDYLEYKINNILSMRKQILKIIYTGLNHRPKVGISAELLGKEGERRGGYGCIYTHKPHTCANKKYLAYQKTFIYYIAKDRSVHDKTSLSSTGQKCIRESQYWQ
jgi:hypothetical protein